MQKVNSKIKFLRTYDSVSKACPFGAKRALLGHYCHIFLLVDEAENPINSFYFVQSVTHYRILNVPVT
jgi:hypothetical protein